MYKQPKSRTLKYNLSYNPNSETISQELINRPFVSSLTINHQPQTKVSFPGAQQSNTDNSYERFRQTIQEIRHTTGISSDHNNYTRQTMFSVGKDAQMHNEDKGIYYRSTDMKQRPQQPLTFNPIAPMQLETNSSVKYYDKYFQSSHKTENNLNQSPNRQSYNDQFNIKGYTTLKKEIEEQIDHENSKLSVKQSENLSKSKSPYHYPNKFNDHLSPNSHSQNTKSPNSHNTKSPYEQKSYISNPYIKEVNGSDKYYESGPKTTNNPEESQINQEDSLLNSKSQNNTVPNLTPSEYKKVRIEDLNELNEQNDHEVDENPDKYYSKYNKLTYASNNLGDYREISRKADKQLQELENLLKPHNGVSSDKSSDAKYLEKYQAMLNEDTERPSAYRKFNQEGKLSTSQKDMSESKMSASKQIEDELKGSHTMKFFENVKNSFEPIESELKRIRDILDNEK